MLIMGYSLPAVLFGVTLFIVVVYKHRNNIRRLLNGKEDKVGAIWGKKK